MKHYPDASLIVSASTRERASEVAIAWFAERGPGELVVSDWCDTEVASAMARKVRDGEITPVERDASMADIRAIMAASAESLPVTAADFRRAADLLLGRPASLRAGDALHLAIAGRAEATLWSLDKRMVEAGQALGLSVRLLA